MTSASDEAPHRLEDQNPRIASFFENAIVTAPDETRLHADGFVADGHAQQTCAAAALWRRLQRHRLAVTQDVDGDELFQDAWR